jgi:chromosome segregation ATPase
MQIASLKQIYTQFDNIKPELEAQRTAFQAKKEKLEKEMTHCLVNNEKIESCLKTFRKEMAKLSSAIEVRKEWFKMEIAPADPWWSGIIKFLFLQKRYY